MGLTRGRSKNRIGRLVPARLVGRDGCRVTVGALGAPLATQEGRTGGKGTFQGRTPVKVEGLNTLSRYSAPRLLSGLLVVISTLSLLRYKCVNFIENYRYLVEVSEKFISSFCFLLCGSYFWIVLSLKFWQLCESACVWHSV